MASFPRYYLISLFGEFIPKGAEAPIRIYEVGGIGDPYHLALEAKDPAPVLLATQVPLLYAVLDGKDAGGDQRRAFVYGLSRKGAEMQMEQPLDLLTNIKMNLSEVPEELAARDFYGKVIETAGEAPNRYRIRFTSASPEIAAYFHALRQYVRFTVDHIVPLKHGGSNEEDNLALACFHSPPTHLE